MSGQSSQWDVIGKGAEGGDWADDPRACSLGEKSFSQHLPHNECLIDIYINTVNCHDYCFFYH